MGEIVIKKKNTTIDLFNYKPFRSVTKAELSRTLMSDDYVDISVECANPLDLSLGDRVVVEGRTFFLNMLPPAKKLAEDQFSYELRFEGPAFLLRKSKVFDLDSQGNKTNIDVPLTGEINEFLYLIINNANKWDNKWVLGDFPSNTETKSMQFSNENCLAALQRICQEFNVEFDIVEAGGKFTLNIREKIGKTLSFTVEYGMGNGLYDLSRARANDSEVVTVLYAYGSSQNIPVDYRGYSPRLRMPVAVGDYISNQAAIDLFGYVEDVFTPDIKPTFKGKVSGVGSLANGIQEISVSNMDFDLKEKKADGSTKYLIAGTPAKISVTKGDLAGYDFEVVDYIHSTKTFKLKQFADDRGQKFPDNTTVFKFAAGDEFTLIDIMMPDQYITNAEQKLYDETVKEYQKVSQNNVKYTLNVDPLFLQDKGEIGIGDLLPIKDADFGIDKASRIISLKKDLLTDTYTSFDVADSYEISLVKEIVNNIKDLQKEIASQKVINRQSYLDGYRRVEDRFSMYFDADGKMDGSHIKADTIDVGMLSSGSKSRWFQLEEVVFTPNLGSDPNSFRATAGRLVHFGIKTSSGAERVWNLSALTVNNLLNQGYYVYAKCDINGDYGTFIVTPDRIIFDSQPNYYHFLIGNLYSPSNGFRIFDANYGVSQVNGRQITAGEIASVNRRLIIDLDKGEIIGKVTFTNDSPALNQVQEKIDAVQVGGKNYARNSKIESTKYFNALQNITSFTIENGNELRIRGGNQGYLHYTGVVKIEKTEIVTISFLVKNNFGGEVNNLNPTLNGNGGFGMMVLNGGQGWTKYEKTGLISSATANDLQSILFECYNAGTFDISIKEIKIEKGNKSTDWSPAPEDVDSKIDNVNFGSVNLLDNTAVFGMNANDVGLGTSVLIENEGEKFYRATPDNGKRVSLYGVFYTLEYNQEYVRGVYVRHSAPSAQDIRISSHNTNIGGDKITSVLPNTWTFIKTNVITGGGGNSALIMEMLTTNIPLDYKKTILVKGNRLGNDWMPSSNDVNNEITVANQNAANAQNTANTAAQNAIDANKKLSDIANDNIVTPQEKPDTLKEWKQIEAERPKLIAQAGTYNINTDNYNNYYVALANYLTNSGVFLDMSVSTNVDGREFKNNFQNYYDVRQDLLKAISDAAKTYASGLVDNLQIGGRNLLQKSANIVMSGNDHQNSDNSVPGVITVLRSGKWNCYNWLTLPSGYDKIGKQLTMSLELLVDNQINFGVGVHFAYEQNLIRKDVSYIAPGKWTKVFITYDKITGTNTSLIGLDGIDAPVGTKIKYRNFKLEEGNKATDWTPAPEDVQEQLTNAQNSANTANQKLADIANDNLLTISEKPEVVKEWQEIDTEYPKLIQQSNSYNVDNSIYRTFYSALSAYLLAIQYDNFTIDTPINGQEFRQKFREYYDGRADLLSRITTATKNYTNQAAGELRNEARLKLLASQYTNGNCLYRDADFRSSLNGLSVYNNSSNGTVELFLWTASAANAPTKSPNMAICRYNGGGAQPYLGGFYFGTPTRANAVFVVRLIMRLDVGYQITFHSNQAGDNYSFDWATPVDGTGKWEEYIGVLRCGATGIFNSSMFFAILGANKVIETYIAYASVFDVTDVDRYLEDKIKQNEQQAALAKAQADNALSTANRVSQLTSFMNTTVDGNVIASGTMLVGDVTGGNAGITGVTDQGSNSVRIFAGANYANKDKAPLNILDNGLIKMHHPNGNKGFELGIVNGKLVFNVYDDVGNKIMEMGSAGIVFANYIPDSWSTFYLGKFNSSSYNPYNLNEVSYFANANTKQEMLNNPGNINDPEHWLVTIPKSDSEWVNYSQYSAGTSYDSNTYKKYEGIYYKGTLQKPQKPNDYTEKLADGWYYYTVSTHVWKQRGNPNMNGRYEYAFTLFRLSNGQLVETLNYELSGIV